MLSWSLLKQALERPPVSHQSCRNPTVPHPGRIHHRWQEDRSGVTTQDCSHFLSQTSRRGIRLLQSRNRPQGAVQCHRPWQYQSGLHDRWHAGSVALQQSSPGRVFSHHSGWCPWTIHQLWSSLQLPKTHPAPKRQPQTDSHFCNHRQLSLAFLFLSE